MSDRAPPASGAEPAAPSSYRVLCISMYQEDIRHMDALVDELKRRGTRRANRSLLIRYALRQLSIDEIDEAEMLLDRKP